MNHEEFGATYDYLMAFGALIAEGIPDNHLALLRAHHAAPGHTATWAQLAAAIGYANGKAVNLQYGTLAGRVAQQMGITIVPNGFWLDVLAGWADQPNVDSGHTSFVMRRPVVDALTRLGVLRHEPSGSGRPHSELVRPEGSKPHTLAGVPREEIDHVFRWSQFLSSDQYLAGFRRIANEISELQRRILESQYYSPAHTAYATQLAQSACVTGGHPVVNLQYGRLGRAFMNANGYSPDRRHDGTARWWSALSAGHHTRKGFIWEMLPQVAQALERLGWVTVGAQTIGDESPIQEPLREGTAYQVIVNTFERNPLARRLCIAHHGLRCVACGFDFHATYGPTAEGFIHVHHVLPLSRIQNEYVVDPIHDLRPVCANCHAAIHLGGACRTVEEIRELIKKHRDGESPPEGHR